MKTGRKDGAGERAMATRRAVLGDAHVDRAQAGTSALTAPFQEMITEAAWGRVWSNDAITRRERSMITLALLAAGGHWEEFEMHLRATARTGATMEDVQQVLMHVAIYVGVPAANHGFGLAAAMFGPQPVPGTTPEDAGSEETGS